MLATLLGITTLASPLQPTNSEPPILVTLFGISNSPVIPMQPLNAESAILVTQLGITKLPVNPLQP